MRVAEELMGSYQHKVDGLRLTPGPKGIFDVTVNGELIFSKHANGGHAEPGEVLDIFSEMIGPDVRRYGT